MESQKEAPTLQEPVARPELREGGAVLATAALGTEADDAGTDWLWEPQVQPAERRPECSRCSRPQKVCLCPFLPAHPLHISTHLYIIQHPAEENKMFISSQYVIRMQPTNRSLSTLECAAVALSILEKNNYIKETFKEHLLKNGLYPKPMPKNKRKLRKMQLLKNSVKI
uniref:tRNA-uridine aminocarboxypropyltransferase n=1 Tax=Rhinopithecus bieti TaxID=61621 RepID=A0A2K6K299_RHIBE